MKEPSATADGLAHRDAMDAALIRMYRASRDRRRLERLVERFQPLVRAIATRYVRAGEPLDDVMQVALLGLVKAIERYEPQAGAGFGAFARVTIDGEIKRHLRDHAWTMRIPRSAKELWVRVNDARRQHPDASDAELAGLLQIELPTLREALDHRHALRPESIDFTGFDDGSAMAAGLGTADPGYGVIDDRDEVDRALAILEPRDREVVRLRYVDDALQREIGDRVGVSQMQVSRILNRSLEQMRNHLGAEPGVTAYPDDPSVAAS